MRPNRWAHGVAVERPGVASPLALSFVTRVLRPIVRVAHRPTLEGAEHLPASGPFLLVANHSGSLGLAEINTFMVLYAERFGGTRPLAAFAHGLGFSVWPVSRALAMIGAIPSTYAAAEATLAAGVPILVFPGGDHEVSRPFWQAHRVDFAGRRGFLRIAHKAWVPIVPMGIRGSHLSAPPLFRSPLLAWAFVWPRLFGVRRFPFTLLALLGALMIVLWVPLDLHWRVLLAWAWAGSPFALLPFIPTRIHMNIGPPIDPETLFGAQDESADDDTLASALRSVEGVIQALVDSRSGDRTALARPE